MGRLVVKIDSLPSSPLDAAASFQTDHLPAIRQAGRNCAEIAICFPAADHTHRAWRLAMVQALARELAPVRVNGVSGGDAVPVAQVTDYLAAAAGVTGQILSVDGNLLKLD